MRIHTNSQSSHDLDLRIKISFHSEIKRITYENLTKITHMSIPIEQCHLTQEWNSTFTKDKTSIESLRVPNENLSRLLKEGNHRRKLMICLIVSIKNLFDERKNEWNYEITHMRSQQEVLKVHLDLEVKRL